MSVNKVILVGNLGKDPESRTTQGGHTVTNMRIATTERQKDSDGNWGEHTEWHSIVCWGRTAENTAKYLSKGRQIYVEGRLRTRKWQDRDGNDRWSTEVVADTVQFLGNKGGGGGGGGNYGGGGGDYGGGGGGNSSADSAGGASGASGGAASGSGGGGADDDIPF